MYVELILTDITTVTVFQQTSGGCHIATFDDVVQARELIRSPFCQALAAVRRHASKTRAIPVEEVLAQPAQPST